MCYPMSSSMILNKLVVVYIIKKMSQIQELHKQAMDLAEMA